MRSMTLERSGRDERLHAVVHRGGFPFRVRLLQFGGVRGVKFLRGLAADEERFARPVHLRHARGDAFAQTRSRESAAAVQRDADGPSADLARPFAMPRDGFG